MPPVWEDESRIYAVTCRHCGAVTVGDVRVCASRAGLRHIGDCPVPLAEAATSAEAAVNAAAARRAEDAG